MATQSQIPGVRVSGSTAENGRQPGLRAGLKTLVVTLTWGLGDVLLSTSALHEFKQRHPETRIVFKTFTDVGRRRKLTYAQGNPAQMLEHNPDIDLVLDVSERYFPEEPGAHIDFHYAAFGGPPLDYPIQAHYWENLGLEWKRGQRFDAFYFITEEERERARKLTAAGPSLVVTLGGGWPGKSWTMQGWMELIHWAHKRGIRPVILSGERYDDPELFGRGIANLTGNTDIRQAGAILAEADYAVMTEGGPSNLRFAVGKPVILLTCATQTGIQIWTPPELTREVRFWQTAVTRDRAIHEAGIFQPASAAEVVSPLQPACEPCMWRRDHVVRNNPAMPPASIKQCPKGISLRDLPVSTVTAALEREIARKGADH